jgi:hypothetical protein
MARLSARPVGVGIAAVVLAAAVVAVFAAASGSAAPARIAAAPKTVTGTLIKRPLHTLKPGSSVSSSRLGQRIFSNAKRGFALASVGGAQYPAATFDGGKTWKTNGPALHLNAAQAPLSVTNVGAANANTLFACCGGQVVDATKDAGKHWWRAFLGGGVLSVIAPGGGRLVAVAQNQGSGGKAINLVYVSRDGGHHWRLNTKLGAF